MRLRYVVVDELHVFRGIFGTHVAHLLRRLRRVAAHYGSHPTFVFTSATIGDPGTLASQLCGLPVEAVTDDGSPTWRAAGRAVAPAARRSRRPPLRPAVGQRRDGRARRRAGDRRPPHHRLLPQPAGHRGGGRRHPAPAAGWPGRDGAAVPGRLPGGRAARDRGRALRRDPQRRRRHQRPRARRRRRRARRLRARRLPGHGRLVLAAGGAGRARAAGVAGRARRRQRPARPVADGAPDRAVPPAARAGRDQPGQPLRLPPPPGLRGLRAAAHARRRARSGPTCSTTGCARWWSTTGSRCGVAGAGSGGARPTLSACGRGGGSRPTASGCGRGRASSTASPSTTARSSAPSTKGRAFDLVHPGAVYLHQGDGVPRRRPRSRRPRRLGRAPRRRRVHDGRAPRSPSRSRRSTPARRVGRTHLHLGSVEVTSQVVGYQRREAGTGVVLASETLDLPPEHAGDPGVLVHDRRPPSCSPPGVGRPAWPGTLHAIEHAAIGMLPLFTICDRWDVGGVSTVHQLDTGRADVLRVRRLPRRGGRRRARLPGRRPPPGRHARRDRRLRLRRRLPVVRAVAQVRQLERAARQGRCPRPTRPDPGPASASAHEHQDRGARPDRRRSRSPKAGSKSLVDVGGSTSMSSSSGVVVVASAWRVR